MWPSEGSQIAEPWSSLIRGDERSYLPNLVIPLHELSLLFSNFPNTTAYHWSDANLYLLLAVVLQLSPLNVVILSVIGQQMNFNWQARLSVGTAQMDNKLDCLKHKQFFIFLNVVGWLRLPLCSILLLKVHCFTLNFSSYGVTF